MLTHADKARLAHQALRLRENGIGSTSQVARLARIADTPGDGDEQRVGGPGGHPLANIAANVANVLDPERPGPTDPRAVESLMSRRKLGDIWRAWDEATIANLEQTLPAGRMQAWRKQREQDGKAHAEREAAMLETGDWPVHPAFGHNRHLDGAANALYDLGREGFLTGAIDWDTAVFKVALVDSAVYTVNLATHQFMSSVASVVATSAAIANKTSTAGVADGDDSVFTAVTGAQSEALLIYQSSAVGGGADVAAAAQRVVGYIDTATGLPVTPNGGNITVAWDSGANRIFKL